MATRRAGQQPSVLRDPGALTFEARLQRTAASGAACFVDFPWDLKATFGKGNLVPVQVTWDGRVPYRGSLATMGRSAAMVVCRKDVLAALGKGPGDLVEVTVQLDRAPREVEVPPALAAALARAPRARRAWSELSASCQREYATWIAEAKRAETRAARVEQALARLVQKRRLRG